ncbi:MAG: hypothetical protein CMJ83_16185 [Planctomycetes bacterium]|nr:hypothetical protein [Planctomycetota bacterium]
MRHIWILIIFVALLPVTPAQIGTDHVFVYVDINAPGPGTGTETDPFVTIAAAMAYVIPHDYVFVRPGVYQEVVDLPYFIFLRSTDGADVTTIDATGLPGTHAVTIGTLGEVTGFTIKKDDGAGLLAQSTGPFEFGRVIRRNRVLDCPNGGIHMSGPIHPIMDVNVVAGCGNFGIRSENGASPYMSCNTVTECTIGLEGVGAPPDAQAFFANSIFWGNTTDVSGFAPAGLISCDVGDGTFVGVNNSFNADPMWRNPVARDYRLVPGSPCIDATDPFYVLSSTEFDNRGYGAWRKMDGDFDGNVDADVGALEYGGFESWQSGTGVGSVLNLEVETGPGTAWFLAYGPYNLVPEIPLPIAGSSHFLLWIDSQQLTLLANGTQPASGMTTLSFAITSPALVGLRLPAQALGVDWTGPTYHFTHANVVSVQ